MFLTTKSSLYVFFGGRWVLLLMGLLIYTKSGNVTPGLLLAAVLFHTAYSLLYLFKMGKKAAIAASAVDIGFGIYLLWLTGGLSSPFLIYCFTGLLMVKRFVTWRGYYRISFCYALLLPFIFALTSERAAYIYLLNHFDYSFVVLGYFCLISFAHYTIQAVRKQYRKLVMIYSSRFMARQPRKQGGILYLEGLLKKILDEREVILCMESDRQNEKALSWKHTYFTNYMKQNTSLHGQRMYAQMPSPTGELESLYIQTLLDRGGKSYGWLLVKAEKNELSILHKMYIQFLLMRLEAIHFSDEELLEAEEAAVAIERNTIAQNIHDGITQELFFISIQLFQLKNALPAHARDEMLPYVTEIEKKVKESHRDIRQFITELKDEKRTLNLHYAIEKMLQRITEHTGVKPIFEHIGWVSQEQVDVEGAIYHLVEEAANNVIKHAKAKQLHVTIEVTSVQWTVMIKDDGIGMKSVDRHHEGRFGLGGMESRIRALNGSITFQSEEAMGTTVTAYIPRERSTAYV
ncbi:ATP-binding protein [Paenibacillus chondroitinus]|uniref:histidine kinase n=1 Tax=Paenibacillus chondroitinus TaxID=59842 RepID=A0ABU6DM18_9BACL|nr:MULTISPECIES: ATP-binding protein [Paenibacillus]MCY9663186.1 ATP-binding protein [Paenibacillus anseongense]MEB4798837.1 ATP-binding protein [Paenibacillus chondroitinus]